MDPAGAVIPTLYAGTTLDCALMETVFHDVPFTAGFKMVSKASHIAGKVFSQLIVTRDLHLIDLSPISLRKLGISRKEMIESDGSQYVETRAWAQALHHQYPHAEGLLWTSRQAAPAEACLLFGDRFEPFASQSENVPGDFPMRTLCPAAPLLQSDGAAIGAVLDLALRMDVLLTP